MLVHQLVLDLDYCDRHFTCAGYSSAHTADEGTLDRIEVTSTHKYMIHLGEMKQ